MPRASTRKLPQCAQKVCLVVVLMTVRDSDVFVVLCACAVVVRVVVELLARKTSVIPCAVVAVLGSL